MRISPFYSLATLLTTSILLTSCWRDRPVDPAGPSTDTIPTAGLVAYYPLDGNAGDSSGSGFHGVEKNGVTYVDARNEWAGKAAQFDGRAAFIRVANIGGTRLDLSEAFTQSLWVKGDRKLGIHPWSYLITKANPFGNGYYMKWSHNGEGLAALYLVTGASGTTTPHDVIGLPNTEFIGAWHHLLFTWSKESKQLVMYVDGMLRLSKDDCRYDGSPSSSSLEIGGFAYNGSDTDSPVGSFPGSIDDVRIYDRVLSRSEISALAREGR